MHYRFGACNRLMPKDWLRQGWRCSKPSSTCLRELLQANQQELALRWRRGLPLPWGLRWRRGLPLPWGLRWLPEPQWAQRRELWHHHKQRPRKAITSSAARVLKRNFIVVSFDINLCHIATQSSICMPTALDDRHTDIAVTVKIPSYAVKQSKLRIS
jgi:hypothetical protein